MAGKEEKQYSNKKPIVYYHNSDFVNLEEYIEYMRRPRISQKEADDFSKESGYEEFLKRLDGWNPID